MVKVRQFGTTWWGKAWLDALEQRSLIDPNRLPRGRTYARQDRVRDIELSPGELRAQVSGNQEGPYTTTLSMRVLADSEWDTVLDLAMTKASNVAALLAGQVPIEIVDLVLPDRADLIPVCSRPDCAEPSKPVAALCYVAADMFDAYPFPLSPLPRLSRDARSSHLYSIIKCGVRAGVHPSHAFVRHPPALHGLVHRGGCAALVFVAVLSGVECPLHALPPPSYACPPTVSAPGVPLAQQCEGNSIPIAKWCRAGEMYASSPSRS